MIVVFMASTFMAARDKHLDSFVHRRLVYAQMLAGFSDLSACGAWSAWSDSSGRHSRHTRRLIDDPRAG